MRLVVTALGVTADPTGLGVYAQMVAPRLRRLDSDVAIVSWSGAALDGVDAIAVGALPPNGGLRTAVRRVLWLNTRLAAIVRATRSDAVLHLLPEIGLVSVPQLAVVHDLTPLVAETTWRQRLYFHTVVAASVRRATRVIADSAPTRRDVLRLFHARDEKISVVPAGVDLEMFHPVDVPPPHRPYLIVVGSHAPHKGIDLVLRAYARSDVNKTHDLQIVGPHSRYTPPLQALAGQLGIADRVQWRPYVDTDTLRTLYAAAEAYVSFSSYEGFGLPALEALACGTPVLISDVGAARDFASEATVIASTFEPDRLLPALEHVVQLVHRPGIRECARAAAERFPWERTARGLLSVAHSVGTARALP